MKIAVLTHSLDGIGGIAKHVLYQCRELVAMGHQVDVFAVEYDRARCYPELTQNLPVHALRAPQPHNRDVYNVATGRRMLVYLQHLWRTYREQRQLAASIPMGYDVLNPQGNLIHWAAVSYKRRHGTPVVWMCHDFWPVASQGYRNPPVSMMGKLKLAGKRALAYPFERYDYTAVQALDEIAVLSEQVKAQMKTHYGVEATVVRTGLDSAHFAQGTGDVIKARFGLAQRQFVLLTVALLLPRRRVEDVIRAVRILVDQGVDTGYLVVGRTTQAPSYTRFLEAQIATNGLEDHIRLAGEVSEDELRDSYQACDAFIWPADETQSWGMACLEAMAAGKPVLVSRANGLAEVLDDGKNAILFAPSNPAEIVQAVQRLLKDPLYRAALAAQGQQFVQKHFSWRRNAEAMLDIFARARSRITEA